MNFGKNKISVVFAFLCFMIFPSQTSQKATLHHSLKEIRACEGKLELTLVREWGGWEPEDEAQIFHAPNDIEVGKDGLFYILDAGNNRIQVFDETGTFIRTIGREGKGPGEFTYPVDITIDNQNNLVISESMGRVQILDSNGTYQKGFKPTDLFPGNMAVNQKGKVYFYNAGRSEIDALFLLYDYEGNIGGKIGDADGEDTRYLRTIKNLNHFALDSEDNLCLGYISQTLLEKYSKEGDLIWQVSYEANFKVPEIRIKNGNIESKMVAAGLSTDRENRIYLAILTRGKNEKEKKVGVHRSIKGVGGSYMRSTMPHDIESPTTDLFQILVFDSSGKIAASQKLDVFCSKVKVHADRLFVIDSYVAAKIYEYKLHFK